MKLDATLDYNWLTPIRLRGTHPYSFRTGQWATIESIVSVNLRSGPRACWKVRYPDGDGDTVAACDTDNYELEYPA